VLRKSPLVSMRMTALLVLGITAALLVGGSTASAKPTFADRLEARANCISERGVGDPVKRNAFRMLYGGKRPFRRCVRYQVKQVIMERRLALPMIRSECRVAQMEAPLEFRMEFPGGVDQCVKIESMP
jgi:hypothetical protein